jgi:hypothetical protein
MKTSKQLTILQNGIFLGHQVFTREKDLRKAVEVMREQLNRRVTLTQSFKTIFTANIQEPF